ncbi:cytochrome P450 [Streptomyces sp. NPDC049879]|uniref:cytochrome P450 n=1 Tax=Streptomyces sp. NPDC049879 TaxID=3365598 RepID=UPI0037A58E7A
MTTHHESVPTRCPVAHEDAEAPAGPIPIHGEAFTADPHATYRRLRAQGPIVPVEISPGVYGLLAVTYRAALHLLRNTPVRFAKDPRHWEALRLGQVPADSPARAMMQPRDNALWKDGEEHARLRKAITHSLGRVDTHALVATVTRIADQLIDGFAAAGKADLVAQYTDPLPMLTVIDMFGCSQELGGRIVSAVTRLFDGADAARANAELEAACLELTHLKRRRPGRDVTSHLIAAGLTDPELIQTILLVIGAAAPPTSNHIGNGLRRVLTDPSFAGSVHDGVRPVADALDEVLWDNPPVPNYSPLYALGPQSFEGVELPPGVPILVSFAAANGDPALAVANPAARAGNRGHLAFSAGAHACPAPDLARIIAETALERALDRLPGLDLAVPESALENRPGTFLAGLTALPVRFQPDNRLIQDRTASHR